MGAYETKVYRNVFEQLGKRRGSIMRPVRIWRTWRIRETMMPGQRV